jgi:hypothetical protein
METGWGEEEKEANAGRLHSIDSFTANIPLRPSRRRWDEVNWIKLAQDSGSMARSR